MSQNQLNFLFPVKIICGKPTEMSTPWHFKNRTKIFTYSLSQVMFPDSTGVLK